MLIDFLKKGEVDISYFEKKYNLVLPEEYRIFLETYNGCISRDDTCIFVNDLDAELEIDSLFGFDEEREWLNIDFWMCEYQDELPEGAIIIGCDILKGFFVLLTNDDGRVYYWDDTLNFDISTETSNVYYVCSNFSEFKQLIGGFEKVKG